METPFATHRLLQLLILEESKWQIRTLLHQIKSLLSADIVAALSFQRNSVTPVGLPTLIEVDPWGSLETLKVWKLF